MESTNYIFDILHDKTLQSDLSKNDYNYLFLYALLAVLAVLRNNSRVHQYFRCRHSEILGKTVYRMALLGTTGVVDTSLAA